VECLLFFTSLTSSWHNAQKVTMSKHLRKIIICNLKLKCYSIFKFTSQKSSYSRNWSQNLQSNPRKSHNSLSPHSNPLTHNLNERNTKYQILLKINIIHTSIANQFTERWKLILSKRKRHVSHGFHVRSTELFMNS
jgi:hypothetical protein